MKLIAALYLVLRLIRHGDLPLLLLYAFMVWCLDKEIKFNLPQEASVISGCS